MKRCIVFIALILFLISCDNRTVDPDDMLWAWLHVYENGVLIYDDVLDETDNGHLIVLNLADNSEATLSTFVNIHYSDLPSEDEEEIARDYIILASRENYFTRHYQRSYLDTLEIHIIGALSPIPSGKVCGAVFTEDYYSMRNEAFTVLDDTLIVTNITTDLYGHFESDALLPGNLYDIILQDFPEGDTLSFNVENYYQDYYFDFSMDE
jgi:hypothetical protein